MRGLRVAAARPNTNLSAWARRRPSPAYDEFVGQIAASADDAQENLTTGAVDLTSTYLTVGGYAGVTEPYAIGLRFNGVTIPQGATVPFAELRLIAGSSNSKSCLLRITAQAVDDAPSFVATTGNISGRARTTAYIDWDVPVWTTDLDGPATTSPNISALIQEIVNRPGWAAGQAIVLILETSPAITDTEWPVRRPRTCDHLPAGAAVLYVGTTEGGPDPDPTPTGDFSDGYDTFGFLGRESFNPASPTLKDGTAITGSMLTYHDSFRGWAVSNSFATSGSWNVVNPGLDWTDDVYHLARLGQLSWQPILHVFRLTGDLTLLDRLVAAAKTWKGHMDVEWRAGYDASGLDARGQMSCGLPPAENWSPYDKFLARDGGGEYVHSYTDFPLINVGKAWGNVIELAWVLHVNKGLTSPGGHNYATELAYWKPRIEGFVKTWSGTTGACWEDNYEGETWTTGGRRRAPLGAYPFVFSDGSHSAMAYIPMYRYLGLLGSEGAISLSAPGDASAFAATMVSETVSRAFRECNVAPYGDLINLPRSNWYKGALDSTVMTTAEWATYTGYIAVMLMQLWLMGTYRGIITKTHMDKLGRMFALMHNGTAGATYSDTRGRSDATAVCGLGQYGSPSAQTAGGNYTKGYAYLSAFEPSDGKLSAIATNVVNTYGGYGSLGSPPNAGILQAGQFLKGALAAVGDLD